MQKTTTEELWKVVQRQTCLEPQDWRTTWRQGVVFLLPTEFTSHPNPARLDLQPSNKSPLGRPLPPPETMGPPLTSGKPRRTDKRHPSGAPLTISGPRNHSPLLLGLKLASPTERWERELPSRTGRGSQAQQTSQSRKPSDPTGRRLPSLAGICYPVAQPGEIPPSPQ